MHFPYDFSYVSIRSSLAFFMVDFCQFCAILCVFIVDFWEKKFEPFYRWFLCFHPFLSLMTSWWPGFLRRFSSLYIFFTLLDFYVFSSMCFLNALSLIIARYTVELPLNFPLVNVSIHSLFSRVIFFHFRAFASLYCVQNCVRFHRCFLSLIGALSIASLHRLFSCVLIVDFRSFSSIICAYFAYLQVFDLDSHNNWFSLC